MTHQQKIASKTKYNSCTYFLKIHRDGIPLYPNVAINSTLFLCGWSCLCQYQWLRVCICIIGHNLDPGISYFPSTIVRMVRICTWKLWIEVIKGFSLDQLLDDICTDIVIGIYALSILCRLSSISYLIICKLWQSDKTKY